MGKRGTANLWGIIGFFGLFLRAAGIDVDHTHIVIVFSVAAILDAMANDEQKRKEQKG